MFEQRVMDSEIVQSIKEFQAARGYPPTIREIMVAVGLRSTSAVSYRLRRLESAGRIARDPGIPRGIRMLS